MNGNLAYRTSCAVEIEKKRPTFFVLITRFFTFHFSLFLLLFLSLDGFTQPGAEIGVIGGAGYYLGEYNPSRHFKYTEGYFGGLYRLNLNDRFAVRLNAGFSRIDIRHVTLPDDAGTVYPDGFEAHIRDFGLMAEFNFRSFMVPKVEKSSLWSPYVYAGVGYLTGGGQGGWSVPVGVGIKLNVWGPLSCGVEWGCRKLFTDKLDGLEDPWKTGETNFIFNKDWIFVSGLTLTYRFPIDLVCWGY